MSSYLYSIDRKMRYVTIVLVALLLTACGDTTENIKSYLGSFKKSEKEKVQPAKLVNFEPVIDIKRLWSERVGDGTDGYYLKLRPAYANRSVYIAGHSGEIHALRSNNGDTLWREKTELSLSGGPFADEEMVIVGTTKAEVLALDAESGERIWQARVSSEVLSTPQRSGDYVVVRSVDGNVFAFSASTGEQLWVQSKSIPPLTLRGNSDPVIINDIVVIGYGNGQLSLLELTNGEVLWDAEVSSAVGASQLERLADIDARPVVTENIVYVAGYQGGLAALQLATGAQIWKRDISIHSDLLVDGGRIYASDEEGIVWALDRLTGNTIWQQENLKARSVSAPAIMDDTIVVADFEGYVHWLDRFTGDFVEREKTGGGSVLSQPVFVDNILYTYASNGTLTAWAFTGLVSTLTAEEPAEDLEDTENTTTDGTASDDAAEATSADTEIGDISSEVVEEVQVSNDIAADGAEESNPESDQENDAEEPGFLRSFWEKISGK